jgi:hypothetical protein
MKHLLPIASAVEKAAQSGLRDAGKVVLRNARDLSPTDSGDSDKSGFVAVDDLTLQVGFRSLVSRLQHENLDWQHLDGGEPKFLERAASETDIGAIIAASVRRELGG